MSGAFAPPSTGGGTTTWASPGTIGSTTPNTGRFTSLTQSGALITTPSVTQALIATTSIACNAACLQVSAASPITLTLNPQIAVGTSGQRVMITNVGSQAITFVNGNGLLLPQNIPLYGGKSLEFTYISTYSSWVYNGLILDHLRSRELPQRRPLGLEQIPLRSLVRHLLRVL